MKKTEHFFHQAVGNQHSSAGAMSTSRQGDTATLLRMLLCLFSRPPVFILHCSCTNHSHLAVYYRLHYLLQDLPAAEDLSSSSPAGPSAECASFKGFFPGPFAKLHLWLWFKASGPPPTTPLPHPCSYSACKSSSFTRRYACSV